MEWKKIECENGMIFMEPYPSKASFLEEASRTDVDSFPLLHIGIWHVKLDTIELFNLLNHEFPPSNLKNKKMRMKLIHEFMEGKHMVFSTIVPVNDVHLKEKTGCEPTMPYSEQIVLWISDFSKESYRMWIHWCKQILKKKQRWAEYVNGVEKIYNPFVGLRFRIWVEFHD